MINITEATVRTGESLATFPITVPRPTGMASAQQRCLGKPRHFSCTSTTVRMIPNMISVWLLQTIRTFAFTINTGRVESNKPNKMARKMSDHFDRADTYFSMQLHIPKLAYNDDDVNDPHWVLDLPGRSAFYSAHPYFFASLGFGNNLRLQRENTLMDGKRNQKVFKDVSGFWNAGTSVVSFRGDTMFPGQSMDANLGTAAAKLMPKTMMLQVELMDWGVKYLANPTGERTLQLATQENAVRVLNLQMKMMVTAFGLVFTPITFKAVGSESVRMTNEGYAPDPGVTIIIEFNDRMNEAYGLELGRRFTFALNAKNTYDFVVPTTRDDPFEGKYPVIMRASGTGLPISFVEGLGHTSVFAYLSGEGAIMTNGMTFETERSYLTLEFFDRDKQLVVFKDSHKIEMFMQFQFL